MIDDISLQILKILQEKARIPNVEVARQVGMAPSAVLERIRKLEKNGYIDGYEVRLNPRRLKRDLIAFIGITCRRPGDATNTGAFLSALSAVQEVHHIAGEDGLLIKVRVRDTEELGRLIREELHADKSIAATETTVVLSTFKETALMPLDDIDLNGR
ncbi:MAG: Lrp/AsnC family transcriptional regulator [Desulfosarcinaceae bacterium]|nr:Lrp/AsnC family transcriptional regulator [Desulfosarcinaceae bacterium]